MDLAPYVDELGRQLLVAAEPGGDEVRAVAERLTASIEASARMVLLDALAAAAADITLDLAPGSVEVRLRGRDPEFVVTSPPADVPHDTVTAAIAPSPTAARPPAPDADEGSLSRITLRLAEQLKGQVEDAAARDGVSVNAWLVRSITAALDPHGPAARPDATASWGGQRFTGWVR